MELAGEADVAADWRIQTAIGRGFDVYAATVRRRLSQIGFWVVWRVHFLARSAGVADNGAHHCVTLVQAGFSAEIPDTGSPGQTTCRPCERNWFSTRCTSSLEGGVTSLSW